MSLTREEREVINKTHDKVGELTAILLGARGDNGLIGDVKRLSTSHYKLRQHFWVLVGILVGSGIIGGGLYGLFNGG